MSGGRALARDPEAFEFDRLPPVEAGCRMPTRRAIIAQDDARWRDAQQGSAALLERLRKSTSGRAA